MKNKLFFIAFFTSGTMALDLMNGIGITAEVEDALWDTSIPYAIARQGQRSLNENSSVVAFIDQPNFVFSLSSDNYLVQTARVDRKVTGSWKIEAFNDSDLEPEIKALYESNQVRYVSRTMRDLFESPLGCFARVPLRYGDMTGDENSELVIYAQNQYKAVNMSVFSPETGKVIFQVRVSSDDSTPNIRAERTEGEDDSPLDPLANKPTDGQYLSLIAEDYILGIRAVRSAIKNYSKIYIGDFDENGKQDLISWRKLYKSRENQDPIKGFQLIRDQVIHYKLISGEYKKQETEQDVIKGWLEAKNLTWQKGYPSKSECPGQEGQLIPEMHDPLLNDPDVLK